MYLGAILIVLLVEHSATLDPGCDYVHNVQPGEKYYIYSKEYPNSYKPGSQCRWTAICPLGFNCKIDCKVNLPESKSCSVDRLIISGTRDSQPTSSDYYCGQDNITAVSVRRTLTVALNSSLYSKEGGKFFCELVAHMNTTKWCACGYTKIGRITAETQVEEENKRKEYPMMAGIVNIEEMAIECGAVIISKTYVLTAAHCVKGKYLNQTGVIVGNQNTSNGNDSPASQFFKVQWYKIHPRFTTVTYDYDIAAVKILGEILFSALVGPVCLPFKFSIYDFKGEKVTILGWDKLHSSGEPSNSTVVHKVNMNVISHSTCNHYISTVTTRQMCTYARGKDTCLSDSGGPVLYADLNRVLYLVGIASYGKNCTWTMPGVNTRITALLDWIVITAPDNYCVK